MATTPLMQYVESLDHKLIENRNDWINQRQLLREEFKKYINLEQSEVTLSPREYYVFRSLFGAEPYVYHVGSLNIIRETKLFCHYYDSMIYVKKKAQERLPESFTPLQPPTDLNRMIFDYLDAKVPMSYLECKNIKAICMCQSDLDFLVSIDDDRRFNYAGYRKGEAPPRFDILRTDYYLGNPRQICLHMPIEITDDLEIKLKFRGS